MFRPMRRSKQQLPEAEAIQILKDGKQGVLAVLGDNGYPYTVPLNYVYADGKIYFHGAKAGHKFDAITACDKVSFCVIEKDDIVAEKLTTYFKSVVAFGRAKILSTEAEIFEAAKILGMKYSSDTDFIEREIKEAMARLCCVEITLEHITGKEAIELAMGRKPLN